jgi:hypothetical protein
VTKTGGKPEGHARQECRRGPRIGRGAVESQDGGERPGHGREQRCRVAAEIEQQAERQHASGQGNATAAELQYQGDDQRRDRRLGRDVQATLDEDQLPEQSIEPCEQVEAARSVEGPEVAVGDIAAQNPIGADQHQPFVIGTYRRIHPGQLGNDADEHQGDPRDAAAPSSRNTGAHEAADQRHDSRLMRS